MPLKKKPSMSKSAERRSTREVPPAGEATNGQAAPQRAPGRSQMEAFQEGMRLFHARQFQQARDLFSAASSGPDRAVSHRAGLHVRMCDQRLASPGVVLKTPEDHYNYAVTLMNSRDLAGAQKHLRAALEADPSSDHVLYALAACLALSGDVHGAYENLKRAIDLQPRNRLAARQDPDFASVADQPALARLLHPDKKA